MLSLVFGGSVRRFEIWLCATSVLSVVRGFIATWQWLPEDIRKDIRSWISDSLLNKMFSSEDKDDEPPQPQMATAAPADAMPLDESEPEHADASNDNDAFELQCTVVEDPTEVSAAEYRCGCL